MTGKAQNSNGYLAIKKKSDSNRMPWWEDVAPAGGKMPTGGLCNTNGGLYACNKIARGAGLRRGHSPQHPYNTKEKCRRSRGAPIEPC